MKSELLKYSNIFNELNTQPERFEAYEMPGNAYFIDDNAILAIPGDDGDCRYPYGKDGFNYWTYASGYMHSNEGLFSPFLRASEGQEPKIAFFAGLEEDGQYDMFSLLSVPVIGDDDVTRYTIFTKSGTYFIAEKDHIIYGIRTFVDEKRNIYYTLQVVNKSGQAKNVKISTFFNPFVKNSLVENSTDRWFRKVEHFKSNELGSFQVEAYEEKDRSSMTTNFGILSRSIDDPRSLKNVQITTSRYDYVGGIRSSLHSAKAVKAANIEVPKKVSSFTETAICADMIEMTVKDSRRIDIRFAFTFEESEAIRLRNENVTPLVIDSRYEEVQLLEDKSGEDIQFRFDLGNDSGESLKLKEHVFNGFMEHLKKQVEFCSVIKGYIQLSHFSLIGIRDVFQALEGYLYWQPEVAKNKMLEALDFLSPEGRLPRQYSLPVDDKSAPAMDLRPFIDQGVWVISAIATYLRQTKNYRFLEETCGYYDVVDDHKHIAKKNDLRDSVLEHMLKIMNYLLINRDHDKTKCVLALYGDWNDALDGLGKTNKPGQEYGTGVSVMATLQVYQNLQEMVEILGRVDADKYADTIAMYKKAQDEIRGGLFRYALRDDRILHGWGDEMSYLVGSIKDPDGVSRDGLTSNAFWILTNLYRDSVLRPADGEMPAESVRRIILNAYRRLDSKYGLKTFHPHFEKGTHGVGRIPNLPEGTAENGATYIHASMFAVMSLFAIGEGKKAWSELSKLLPFTHDKVSISPYVAPNSYGYNEALEIDGESMSDWQTGSSNVLLKTIIRYVFGYEPTFDGLYIQPSSFKPFDKIEMAIKYMDHTIILKVKNEAREKRIFKVNGKEFIGSHDRIMDMDRLYLSDETLNDLPKDEPIIIEVID